MLNPWVLLGIGIVWALSVAFAYTKGSTHATNAAKAAHADAMDDAVANAREMAKTDIRMAVEAEEKRHKARVEFKDRIVTVTKEINAKPLPATCRLSDDSLRLFNDVIRSANDPAPAAEPPVVPPAAPTRKRNDAGTSARVSFHD